MKIPQNKYQTPFRDETRLSESMFQNFCRKNGVILKSQDILFLWEKKLFFPVERIYLECFPKRKVFKEHNGRKRWIWVYPENLKKTQYEKLDSNIYYEHGAVYSNNKKGGPIKKGFKKARKSFPSQEKTPPTLGKMTHMENTDPTVFKDDNEIFFDKTQILLLKMIFHSYQSFSQVLDKEKLKNIGLVKSLQKQIKEANQFLTFYHEMEKTLEQMGNELEKKIEEIWKEYPDDKDERKQEYVGFLGRLHERYQSPLQKILEKHKISEKEFDNWRNKLSEYSFLNSVSYNLPFCRNYLKDVKNKTLINGEYINYMIYQMNLAWIIMTKKEISVSQVLLSITDYRLCEICQVIFKPRNKRQITCGREYCVNAHKKRLKQLNNHYHKKKKN